MSIRVELFVSPGCTQCAYVKTMSKFVVDELGQDEFTWRAVDILEESTHAASLGVTSSPAIATEGQLVFSSAPKANEPAEHAGVSSQRRSCHGS